MATIRTALTHVVDGERLAGGRGRILSASRRASTRSGDCSALIKARRK